MRRKTRVTLVFCVSLILCSCAAPSTEEQLPKKDKVKSKASTIALDTMTLDNVDPDLIMTDDWSDEGDIEIVVE